VDAAENGVGGFGMVVMVTPALVDAVHPYQGESKLGHEALT
jgi:hypothetical protein